MTLLNLHSHYSILRGTPKIPELIENLHKKGYKSAALTDTGRMHGAIEFYKACLKKDIKTSFRCIFIFYQKVIMQNIQE